MEYIQNMEIIERKGSAITGYCVLADDIWINSMIHDSEQNEHDYSCTNSANWWWTPAEKADHILFCFRTPEFANQFIEMITT